MDQLNIAYPDEARANEGPTAMAMRQMRPVAINNVATDASIFPWREAMQHRGFKSSCSLPLIVNSIVVASLNLYADESAFFVAEEMELLTELADDISYALEFVRHGEQLDYLTYYDSLTRLANRGLFLERLGEFINRARAERSSLAVLKIDIERFKSINDTYGRAIGDEALTQTAARLAKFAGNANLVARTGSDRFALVVTDAENVEDLSRLVEHKLIPYLERPIEVTGNNLRLAFNVGIARMPEDAEDPESLAHNAEAAMKKAKLSGERLLFYAREMGSALAAKLTLESKLRAALENDEFVLYYQPKVDLRSNKIVGAEALIRWNSPELGLVPPVKFIPLMEENGMILSVGRWALQRARSDYLQWLREGLPIVPLAVNVSPLQLRQRDFVEVVRSVLSREPSDQPGIDIEITESTLLGNVEDHIAKLKAIREMGVQISIDDFGTGYSSLSYLARLPIDAVKIDRSFVLSLTDSADTMSVVSSILSLAHSMNLKVVAEGVDSNEQLKFLRLLRCDQIQGWLFSKAIPPDEFANLLRDGRKLLTAGE